MDLQLRSGSRIGIVGGGPAGCFFALAALRFAREAGLDLQVTIYEPRDFAQPGPKGCNMCAGIIPGFVLQEMRALGLDVPPGVVQSPGGTGSSQSATPPSPGCTRTGSGRPW